MLIWNTYYPVKTLGPGKRFGIWTSGCKRRCKGCMSEDSRSFDVSRNRTINSIIGEIKNIIKKDNIDGVTISGGEPFEQSDLEELIDNIKKMGIDDILVYTGNLIENLSDYSSIISKISVLIDGEYKEELNDNMPLRGSANQRIFILNDDVKAKYLEYLKNPRSFDLYVNNSKVMIIGILPKDGHKYLGDILKKIT